MAKAYGYEIVDFFRNAWPEKHFVDDTSLTIAGETGSQIFDGEDEHCTRPLPLDEKYDLDRFGVILHEDTGEGESLERFFLRWKRRKSVATLQVDVPREQLAEATEKIKALGYKIKA
jgi:hypothetical protein